MPKFILIVDGEKTFKSYPEQRRLGDSYTDTRIYARDSKAAIAILNAFEVDELYLGDTTTLKGTLLQVCNYLEEAKFNRLKIKICSIDSTTASMLQRRLRSQYNVIRINPPECV